MKIVYGTRQHNEYMLNFHKNDRMYIYTNDAESRDYDFSNQVTNEFRFIDDFEILLVDLEYWEIGMQVKFYSNSLGIIVEFPWWDHADRDVKEFSTEDIFLGQPDDPYADMEQGWQIVIFEKDEFVYILVGSKQKCAEFHGAYKIKKTDYLLQWNRLISFLNS